MHYNIKNILKTQGFDVKNNNGNIYLNLYESLKKAIIYRSIAEGAKLPPTRILSNDLEISRSTVIKAYELLCLENYIRSIQGSGYYVDSPKNKELNVNLKVNSKKSGYPSLSNNAKAFEKRAHLINSATSNDSVAFKPGLSPLDVFPIGIWKKLSSFYWSTVKPSELSYSNAEGINDLKKNISRYLKIYRSIDCDSDQIIVTSGSLHSLYLVSSALINKGDSVLMENVSYPHAFRLFKSLQAKVSPLDLEKDQKMLKNSEAKFFYCIPSNQNYSGNKMNMDKRIELVQWASSKGSLIIEDDYEHEFSNWQNPIASIYSLDNQDRVIYLGTFNKLLHPSIRIGYMIVPKYLKKGILSIYEQSSRFVQTETQKIMSLFIEKDYLNRHIRKLVEVSHERKRSFIKFFESVFKDELILDSSNVGLNIIARFKNKTNDIELSKYLSEKGVITNPLSKYYLKEPKEFGLVMGFSCVNTKMMKDSILKMKEEYDNFKSLKKI